MISIEISSIDDFLVFSLGKETPNSIQMSECVAYGTIHSKASLPHDEKNETLKDCLPTPAVEKVLYDYACINVNNHT